MKNIYVLITWIVIISYGCDITMLFSDFKIWYKHKFPTLLFSILKLDKMAPDLAVPGKINFCILFCRYNELNTFSRRYFDYLVLAIRIRNLNNGFYLWFTWILFKFVVIIWKQILVSLLGTEMIMSKILFWKLSLYF